MIRLAFPALVLFGLLGTAATADAQFWEKIKDRAKQAAEREVLHQVDRKVTASVRCTVGDQSCIEKAVAAGNEVEVVDGNGNVVAAGEGGGATAGAATSKPAAKGIGAVDANYDFVPGERVLFAEDFSSDNVGDFPRGLEFVGGNMSVVQTQSGRLLRSTGESVFQIILPETLPERFTIEFDLMVGDFLKSAYLLTEPYGRGLHYYEDGNYFRFSRHGVGVVGNGYPSSTRGIGDALYQLSSVQIMVDGDYAKVYVGRQRLANIPNASFVRTDTLQFHLTGNAEHPSFMGNIRVAAGGRDLYDALSTEGRVTTHGILFDTGSDRIQPASLPTLQQIGTMLQQHPDLRLTIEGHTDSVGDAPANLTLSQQRAEAVKQRLVSDFGIAEDRLHAVGRGAARPVATNDTAEGRQQNRRVELVRN